MSLYADVCFLFFYAQGYCSYMATQHGRPIEEEPLCTKGSVSDNTNITILSFSDYTLKKL